MPSLAALRRNLAVQAFGKLLRANGLAPKAVVGAAMRKLAHLIYGVVKSGSHSVPESPCLGLRFKTVPDPVLGTRAAVR